MTVRTVLCCFGRAELRLASALRDGPWSDRTDAGTWRLEPLLLGQPLPAGASALVLVATETDLASTMPQDLAAIADEAASGRLAVDVVASEAAVRTYLWLSAHAPALAQRFHQDGEVRLGVPSWWRQRIERYLADPAPVPERGATTTVLPARTRTARGS